MKFTFGTIQKIDTDFYEVNLYNKGKLIYKANCDTLKACEYLEKFNNIKLI